MRDPVTGDELTRGEYVSWLVQGVIRRWTFLIVITVITLLAWLTNNSGVLTWWNLSASYLALVIESVVGISMFSQTRRDAVILREIRTTGKHVETLQDQQRQLMEHMQDQLQRLSDLERKTGKLLYINQESSPDTP